MSCGPGDAGHSGSTLIVYVAPPNGGLQVFLVMSDRWLQPPASAPQPKKGTPAQFSVDGDGDAGAGACCVSNETQAGYIDGATYSPQ